MDGAHSHLKRKQPEEGESSTSQGIRDATSSSTEMNLQTLPVQQQDASGPENRSENTSCDAFAAMLTRFDEFLANYDNHSGGESPEIADDSEDPDLAAMFHLDALLDDNTDMHDLWRLDIDDMSHEELVDLEEQMGIINTGLSEYTICEHLRRYIYYKPNISGPQPDGPVCCICLEGIHNEQLIAILDCDHEFHYYCVKEWLQRKNSCPLCRKTGLTPPTSNYSY